MGSKELDGRTFRRHIWLIEAINGAKDARRFRTLLRSMEQEAKAAGATELEIVGHDIVNQGFLSRRVAEGLGFSFRKINHLMVKAIKPLRGG